MKIQGECVICAICIQQLLLSVANTQYINIIDNNLFFWLWLVKWHEHEFT